METRIKGGIMNPLSQKAEGLDLPPFVEVRARRPLQPPPQIVVHILHRTSVPGQGEDLVVIAHGDRRQSLLQEQEVEKTPPHPAVAVPERMDADEHIVRASEIVDEFVETIKAAGCLIENDGEVGHLSIEIAELKGDAVSVRKIDPSERASIAVEAVRKALVELSSASPFRSQNTRRARQRVRILCSRSSYSRAPSNPERGIRCGGLCSLS